MIFSAENLEAVQGLVAKGDSLAAIEFAIDNAEKITTLAQAQRCVDQLLRGVFDNDANGIAGAKGRGASAERPSDPLDGEEFFDTTLDDWIKWNGSSWEHLPSGPLAELNLSEAVQAKINSVVLVKTFGAKGDGATDDTLSIQAAFDSLHDGDTLVFPAGDYVISESLLVPDLSRLTIQGTGAVLSNGLAVGQMTMLTRANNSFEIAGATVTEDISAGDSTITVNDSGVFALGDVVFISSSEAFDKNDYYRGDVLTIEAIVGNVVTLSDSFVFDMTHDTITLKKLCPLDGFKLDGLTFRPNGATDTCMNLCALVNFRVSGVTVSPVTSCRNGIVLSGCQLGTVERCATSNCYEPAGSTNYGIDVTGNYITARENSGAGCRHELTSAARTFVSRGITFRDNVSSGNRGTAAFDFHGLVYDGRMSGNVAVNCASGINARSPYKTTIQGNTLDLVGASGVGVNCVDDLNNANVLSGYIITENRITGGQYQIKADGCGLRETVISHNKFSAANGYAIHASSLPESALHMSLNIIGNIFKGCVSSLSIRNTKNLLIGDNQFIDDVTRTAYIYGTGENTLIRGNTIDGSAEGLRFGGSAGAIVKDNAFASLPSYSKEIYDVSTGVIISQGNLRQGIIEGGPEFITLQNDGSPSVGRGRNYRTGGGTTIFDLDDGYAGQEVFIVGGAYNTTFTAGGNLQINGDFLMTEGDTLHLINLDGTVWHELSRMTY